MTPQEVRELRSKVWAAELRTQQLHDATSAPHTPDPANVARNPASPAAPVLAEEAAAEEFDDRIKIIILDVRLPACREISC